MSLVAEDFSSRIADRIREEHAELAARWLSRLVSLLPVDPNRVFPGDHLLDHIPQLILEIAGYLADPTCEEIAANTQVVVKARDLGVLRYSQRASVHQIMREYRLFEGVLSAFIKEEVGLLPSPSPGQIVDVLARTHQAVSVLLQATVEAFIEQYSDRVTAQRVQLEAFNRMVSHEMRQPLGTLQFALRLLRSRLSQDSEAERSRLVSLLERNVERSVELTTQLTRLSGLSADEQPLQVQRVSLQTVAHEAARQLREMADAKGVDIRVSELLPDVEVDVAAIELVLVNLLSNAIKYSDPAKAERYVEVNAVPRQPGAEWAFEVRDNGLGIPVEYKRQVFDPHFRAHAAHDEILGVKGLGLGLAIVRDCLRTIHGTIALESTEGRGSVFTVSVPVDAPDEATGTSG